MRTIKQEHYFPVLIGIHFIFWWIDLALYSGDYEYNSMHIAGEVFSSWVVTVFAANFLMATRLKWVERLFGGLDKMYMIHRRSGIIAVVLLLAHFIVVPRDPTFTIGKPMGFYALVLILIGVILSAAPIFKRKIKYYKWLNIHKLMGVFYVLGIAHSFNVPTLTSELPIVSAYVYGMAFIGIIAWIYRAFLYNLFNKKLDYTVESVKQFKNDTLEILLQPINKQLKFDAGQFAFVQFEGLNKNEAHPFTISNLSSEEQLRFTVKSLGDYTANIQSALKPGTKASVSTAFGQFNFKKSKYTKQVWLAGGIGITPFLSFIRAIDENYEATLIWSVKSIEQANYKDEIESIIAQKPFLKFVLWNSDSKGYFNVEKLYDTSTVKEKSFYICGPEMMRESYI